MKNPTKTQGSTGLPYDVGYAKPPKSGQFKPGQSGNPKGKAKGTRSLASLLVQHLAAPIPTTINGKTKSISRQEAILLGLIKDAMMGKDKSRKLLIDLILRFEPKDPTTPEAALSEAELDGIIDNYLKSVLSPSKASKASSTSLKPR